MISILPLNKRWKTFCLRRAIGHLSIYAHLAWSVTRRASINIYYTGTYLQSWRPGQSSSLLFNVFLHFKFIGLSRLSTFYSVMLSGWLYQSKKSYPAFQPVLLSEKCQDSGTDDSLASPEYSTYPLCKRGVEDASSRIIYAIWMIGFRTKPKHQFAYLPLQT